MSIVTDLYMQDNDIYTVISVPNSVKNWTCNSNRLRSITLHDGLISVDVSNNNLTKCPAFPDTLETINLSSNNIHELNQLPALLKEINISGNNIDDETIKTIISFYELSGSNIKIIHDQDQEHDQDQDHDQDIYLDVDQQSELDDDNIAFKSYIAEDHDQEYQETIELDMLSLNENSHKKKHKFKFTKNLFDQLSCIDDNYIIVQNGRLEL
jgi:hypothetical protein